MSTDEKNKEFTVYMLNESGKDNARLITEIFDNTLNSLKSICGENSREFSITKTKLEEACFFAKKAMASNSIYQL